MSQARTLPSSGCCSARALSQVVAQPGAGLVQLASSAGQAWIGASCAQPGRSAQSAGCQRAFSRSQGPCGPGAEGVGVRTAGGGLGGSGVLHAASSHTIAATRQPGASQRTNDMGLLLLEALAALILLVFIVWWTMFSGRRGGERDTPPGGEEGPDDRKPPGG
jgi:hypothetical protein